MPWGASQAGGKEWQGRSPGPPEANFKAAVVGETIARAYHRQRVRCAKHSRLSLGSKPELSAIVNLSYSEIYGNG